MLISAAARPIPPGHLLAREFGRDIVTLPGIEYIAWLGDDPAGAHVIYEDAQLRALGAGILRDVIGGAHLVLDLDDDVSPDLPTPPPGRAPWWTQKTNLFRAVAAMPGVSDYRYEATSNTATFFTSTPLQAAHLSALVRDTIAGAHVAFAAAAGQ